MLFEDMALLSIVIILLLLGIIFIVSTKRSDDEEEMVDLDEEENEDYDGEEMEVIDTSELAAALDLSSPEDAPERKENDMEFIQSILEGDDEIETILPEDLDNLPKVSRYNNDKDWL